VTEIADRLECNSLRAEIVLGALAQVHLLERGQSTHDGTATYRARWSNHHLSSTDPARLSSHRGSR
jgi:hypothetical protein